MTWHSKEHESRFDTTAINGLFFLDGDIVERMHPNNFTWGMKSPMIEFPSGEVHPVWDEYNPQVEVLPAMDLPLFSTRDRAYEVATKLMSTGLVNIDHIEKIGESQLLLEAVTEDRCLVTYDNDQALMSDCEVTLNDYLSDQHSS